MRRLFASSIIAPVFTLSAALLTPALAEAKPPVPATPCNADPFFCERAAIQFERIDALPIQWKFDTGWVPQNSPLQVHILAGVYANTHVSLAGALLTTWPQALDLETPGDAMGGDFGFHYGAELSAQGKIEVTIAGQTFKWTGDLPYVPQFDFQVEADKAFDAWAYDPGISLSSKTKPQKIATVSIADVVGGSIPGIDGGFELDVAMELNATYTTQQVVITTTDGMVTQGGAITKAGQKSFTPYLSGPSIDLDVHPEGTVDYDGVLHLIPAFYITLLGKSFQIPIADIPIAFPITKTDWIFEPERVHVPLPDLVSPKTIDLGDVPVGQQAIVPYSLWNAGEAKVFALIASSDPAASPADLKLEIQPGITTDTAVAFTPTQHGDFSAKLLVTSNDPSEPDRVILLKGYGAGDLPWTVALEDQDASQDSSCACRAAGDRGNGDASSGAIATLALGALVLRTRRRRQTW
jgi:hypothetical protein